MNSFYKFLLGVGVLAVIVIAALYILGSKRDRHSTTLLIDVPPATVFGYLTDSEKLKKWVGGLVEVEPMGDLSNEVGARTRVTVMSNGRAVESEDEIIRYEVNELFSVQSTAELRIQTSIFQLEPKDNGKTQLTYKMWVSNNKIRKILGPFIQTAAQEKIEIDARKLKDLIERQSISSTLDEEEYSGSVSTENDSPAATISPDDDQ